MSCRYVFNTGIIKPNYKNTGKNMMGNYAYKSNCCYKNFFEKTLKEIGSFFRKILSDWLNSVWISKQQIYNSFHIGLDEKNLQKP